MTTKPSFCPVCYTDLRKVMTNKKVKRIKCPNKDCGVILNCDTSSTYVRCINCNRLFADTITYKDHLDIHGDCPFKNKVRWGVLIE